MRESAPKPSMPRTTVAPASPSRANALDDCLVERLAVPRVGLPDEDAQELPLAFDAHQTARAATTPR